MHKRLKETVFRYFGSDFPSVRHPALHLISLLIVSGRLLQFVSWWTSTVPSSQENAISNRKKILNLRHCHFKGPSSNAHLAADVCQNQKMNTPVDWDGNFKVIFQNRSPVRVRGHLWKISLLDLVCDHPEWWYAILNLFWVNTVDRLPHEIAHFGK